MPINITVAEPNGEADQFANLKAQVLAQLGLPDTMKVRVEMNRTIIMGPSGVTLTVPCGAKQGKDLIVGAVVAAEAETLIKSTAKVDVVDEPIQKHPDEMDDDEWVIAQYHDINAEWSLVPLQNCKNLHARVAGTSSNSVYRTCFLGPDLKVACRFKGSTVSFRVTTSNGTAPTGDLRKAIVETLGVNNVYEDRITCHSNMPCTFVENEVPYRALFGAFYGALMPWISTPFPNLQKLSEGTS